MDKPSFHTTLNDRLAISPKFESQNLCLSNIVWHFLRPVFKNQCEIVGLLELLKHENNYLKYCFFLPIGTVHAFEYGIILNL